MASAAVFVSEIARKLSEDDMVIRHKRGFSCDLETPVGKRKQWEDLYARVLSDYGDFEHLYNLLEEWVERTSPNLGTLRKILKQNTYFTRALESLECLGDDSSVIKINGASMTNVKNIRFRVMQPTSKFVGRIEEMKTLLEEFNNRSRQPVVVISGMGGQGKTELCRQFIKTLQNQRDCPSLIWLSGDSASNLTSSVTQLAQHMEIPATVDVKPIPFHQLLVSVADKIANISTHGWVVVVDNVDEGYPDFNRTIPILVGHGAFVVVTSRKIDILSGEAKQIKLDVLTDDDARTLTNICLNAPPSEEDAQNLCKELGNHALALRHALSYINALQNENRFSYGIKEYLQDFAKDRSLLNNENFVDGYDQTIFLIVTRTLNTIHEKHGELGERTAELMEILCLIKPDGISLETLQKFQNIVHAEKKQQLQPEHALHNELLLLKKYSLIFYHDPESPISIHRLVQKVTKCHSSNDAASTILNRIETSNCSRAELQQVIHILEQTGVEVVRQKPSLPIKIFSRMTDVSLVLEMKSFAENNLELLTRLLGPDHELTLSMEFAWARALQMNGDYEGALVQFKGVVEKMQRVKGPADTMTMDTIIHIANVLRELGGYEDSLKLNNLVLEARIRVLGSNNEETIAIATRHNVVVALTDLGRLDEALPLCHEVLKWEREHLGPSHPSTLTTRQSMATILYNQGQFEDARAEFEAVLTFRKAVFGEEDTDTLTCKSWLAGSLYYLGREEEALKVMEQVLESREKVLGPNHPHTQLTRSQLSDWKLAVEIKNSLKL